MKFWINHDNDEGAFIEAIEAAERDEQVQAICAMICDFDAMEGDRIDEALRRLKKPIFGGVFPGLICKSKVVRSGSQVIGLLRSAEVFVFKNLREEGADILGGSGHGASPADALESFAMGAEDHPTILVFHDGISSGVERFKEEMFYRIGLNYNYLGGGAGSAALARRPCVITNRGLIRDAAVLAFVSYPSAVGVAHGWKPVGGMLKVTEADRNEIISLNWRPACDVYRERIEALTPLRFAQEPFLRIANSFPLGISKVGSEMIVRDPIRATERGGILCVGEVPQNAFVHILTGDKASLIAGAKEAKRLAEQALRASREGGGGGNIFTLVADCVSRALFLGDGIQEELDSLGDPNLMGALTLGEIANTGKSYLELYNKTIVVGLLEA